jgi:hypothetical protein
MTMKSEGKVALVIGVALFLVGAGAALSIRSLSESAELEQQAKRSHDMAMENGHDAMECELKRLDLALDLLACTAQCPDWVPLERPSPAPSASASGL